MQFPSVKHAILAYAGVAATFVLNMVLSLIRGTCTGKFRQRLFRHHFSFRQYLFSCGSRA